MVFVFVATVACTQEIIERFHLIRRAERSAVSGATICDRRICNPWNILKLYWRV